MKMQYLNSLVHTLYQKNMDGERKLVAFVWKIKCAEKIGPPVIKTQTIQSV